MNQFFIGASEHCKENIIFSGDEANHIKNVLKLRVGEKIQAVCEQSYVTYTCEIESIEKDKVVTKIIDMVFESTELPVQITLLQGLPKGDKFEQVIQKAVELGVYEIVPVQMQRSVVKIDPKKAEAKLKRWQAIAKSAAEQSKRKIIPQVKPIMSFDEALSYGTAGFHDVIVPYELADNMDETREIMKGLVSNYERHIDLAADALQYGVTVNEEHRISVFIGPEGGFADSEIDKLKEEKAKLITLGRRILRTETAPVAILSWLTYLFE